MWWLADSVPAGASGWTVGGLHQARQLWSRARIGRDDAFHVVQVEFNVLFEILD